MNFEHEARIIGMGLLLGEIPFEALARGLESLPSDPEGADLGALLAELQRRGVLTEPTRLSLQAQVSDLERLIQEPSASGSEEATSRTAEPSLPALESLASIGTVPENTASRPSSYGPRARPDLGRNLLSALTLPRWNQFTNLRFIGEGGMGRIFRAFDPTLDRQVALKFLRWVDHGTIADLVREARNQAQVDHPNICKIYEVKEWQGQIYLVMQFLDGQTLDKVAPSMALLQKVELMERVADAVHAAHRKGLIHRDLKPTNIMVAPGHEGPFTPYVLDFGLARDQASHRETRQGAIMGTAHYMAPEQARGDTDRIERRTDVYALGVTLYELFAGAPPFAEIPGMDCLRWILEEPIPRLRDRNPEVPPDLQTIVMKCLEKEPAQRYESARALAEDLRRFRDGEPILARPTSLRYRLGKFARRNRGLVVLAATALAAVLVLAGFGLQTRLTASTRARLAQHYGQEAERIEALLRYLRLLPLHDMRGELAAVERRIQSLETDLHQARSLAQGPGRYALGRAYLALGKPDMARQHLDLAWQEGFQAPEVAYARGRALGQLYARALDDVRILQNPRLRQARLQELEATLRDPALALLRQGQGSQLDPPDFQEGLLARYDRRFDASLRLARSAIRQAPWFYEARRLEGEIRLDQARMEQDPDKALALLGLAGQALESATATAPSDPDLWDLQSRRWWEEMVTLRRAGRSLREADAGLRRACEAWKRLVPESPTAESRLARGELELARAPEPRPGLRGEADPLARALTRAEAGLARNPEDPGLLGALASALQLRAYGELNRGQDPRPALDRAIGLLRQVLQRAPAAFEAFEPFVACHWAKVEYEKSQGRNPELAVTEALQAVHDLAQRHPMIADFHGYLGGLQVELADYQSTHGIAPDAVVAQALVHLDQAIRMAPSRFEFHFSRGNALLASAQHQVLRGQKAEPALAAAESAYRAALDCNASAEGALLGLGEVAVLRCQSPEHRGRPIRELLAEAEPSLRTLRTRGENWRVALLTAQFARLQAPREPLPERRRELLEEAERQAERALALGGRPAPALLAQAQVQVDRARFEDAPPRHRRARRLLEELLRRDPHFDGARQLLAETETRTGGSR